MSNTKNLSLKNLFSTSNFKDSKDILLALVLLSYYGDEHPHQCKDAVPFLMSKLYPQKKLNPQLMSKIGGVNGELLKQKLIKAVSAKKREITPTGLSILKQPGVQRYLQQLDKRNSKGYTNGLESFLDDLDEILETDGENDMRYYINNNSSSKNFQPVQEDPRLTDMEDIEDSQDFQPPQYEEYKAPDSWGLTPQDIEDLYERSQGEQMKNVNPASTQKELYERLEDESLQTIKARLLKLPPNKFKNLVLDILWKMGYNETSRSECPSPLPAMTVLTDKGICTIYAYIDLARDTEEVDIRDLLMFNGITAIKSGTRVFISPRKLTSQALNFAREHDIKLMDSIFIAGKMQELEIGVKNKEIHYISTWDAEYFN